MGRRKAHVGQHVGLGRVHQGRQFGDLGPELIGDLAPLHLGRLGVVLGEGGGDEGRHDTSPATAGVGDHVPHEVDAAALPSGVHHFGHRGLDALVGVRDHELDAAQAAPGELAQEVGPERLGLRRTDIHAKDFAAAVTVDADRYDHRHRDDATILAHLHVGRVDPEIGPLALDGTVEKRADPFVDLLAKAADLTLRHAGAAHRLDQVIDRAGRDTLDVGLLDHRGERFLSHPARLQETGKVAAPAQLRNAQFDCACARLPVPVAVAVALDHALGALLAVSCAGQAANFQLHQSLGCKADHLA